MTEGAFRYEDSLATSVGDGDARVGDKLFALMIPLASVVFESESAFDVANEPVSKEERCVFFAGRIRMNSVGSALEMLGPPAEIEGLDVAFARFPGVDDLFESEVIVGTGAGREHRQQSETGGKNYAYGERMPALRASGLIWPLNLGLTAATYLPTLRACCTSHYSCLLLHSL